jgi:hypothetical protein
MLGHQPSLGRLRASLVWRLRLTLQPAAGSVMFSRCSGGQHHERDLAAGLVLVAGVALVHLHKAGEQLGALGGIGSLGADGKLLGADLELGSAGGAQVVIPGGMVREPPLEAHSTKRSPSRT